MTQMTQIFIDGKQYTVEPGNYTLAELINHTGIPPATGGIVLKTPDQKFGPAQTFRVQGGETFFATAPGEVVPQSTNPAAPGYDPHAQAYNPNAPGANPNAQPGYNPNNPNAPGASGSPGTPGYAPGTPGYNPQPGAPGYNPNAPNLPGTPGYSTPGAPGNAQYTDPNAPGYVAPGTPGSPGYAGPGYGAQPGSPGYVPNPQPNHPPFGGPNAAPVVTTTNLAAGKIGVSYSASVSATGGKAPLTFAVTSGSLPTGLNLNAASGVISGTPTAAGTASFVVTATDSAQVASAPMSLSITVA
jgi:hypothetical protein